MLKHIDFGDINKNDNSIEIKEIIAGISGFEEFIDRTHSLE